MRVGRTSGSSYSKSVGVLGSGSREHLVAQRVALLAAGVPRKLARGTMLWHASGMRMPRILVQVRAAARSSDDDRPEMP